MLHSPYIGPLRDEAASWIEKLKILSEMLSLWLGSQARWLMLVPVFGDEADTLSKVNALSNAQFEFSRFLSARA